MTNNISITHSQQENLFVRPNESFSENNKQLIKIIHVKEDQVLMDVIDSLPEGHVEKNSTGVGATTLEILDTSRNSIIVLPFVTPVVQKAKKHPDKLISVHGGNKANIKLIENKLENDENIKIIIVSESFIRLQVKYPEIFNHKNFHLVIDESHLFYTSLGYRPQLYQIEKIYKNFDSSRRSMISATPLDSDLFDTIIANDKKTLIKQPKPPITGDFLLGHHDGALTYTLEGFASPFKNQKVCIALNSVEKIIETAQYFTNRYSPIPIYVYSSKKNKDRLSNIDYLEIGEGEPKPGFNFYTSSFFHAFDIETSDCDVVIALKGNHRSQSLAIHDIKQFIGRFRFGFKSLCFTSNYFSKKSKFVTDGNLTDLKDYYQIQFVKSFQTALEYVPERKFRKEELEQLVNSMSDIWGMSPFEIFPEGIDSEFYELVLKNTALIKYESDLNYMYSSHETLFKILSSHFQLEEMLLGEYLEEPLKPNKPDWYYLFEFIEGNKNAVNSLSVKKKEKLQSIIRGLIKNPEYDIIDNSLNEFNTLRVRDMVTDRLSTSKNCTTGLNILEKSLNLYIKNSDSAIIEKFDKLFPNGSKFTSEDILSRFHRLYFNSTDASLLNRILGKEPKNINGAIKLLRQLKQVKKGTGNRGNVVVGWIPYFEHLIVKKIIFHNKLFFCEYDENPKNLSYQSTFESEFKKFEVNYFEKSRYQTMRS